MAVRIGLRTFDGFGLQRGPNPLPPVPKFHRKTTCYGHKIKQSVYQMLG